MILTYTNKSFVIKEILLVSLSFLSVRVLLTTGISPSEPVTDF